MSHATTCLVPGGGPAGAVLSLMLARNGVPVTLIESQQDFDREFRGDTLHPSSMEIMDELGMADDLLKIPHTRVDNLTMQTRTGPFRMVDFSTLPTKFPYITVMPQVRFLEYVTQQAARLPAFRLLMGVHARELLMNGDHCAGLLCRGPDGKDFEIRALLTVGADGRFSRLRKLAKFEPVRSSPPMDVLWLRIPKLPGDTTGFGGRIGGGHVVAVLPRETYYQVGFVILKGSYHELREKGIAELQSIIAELVPEFAGRVATLKDWSGMSILQVESNYLRKWWLPGLLLIGDAAHAMSPVGGVGINYAIMDAVVAANELTEPLRRGTVTESDLARVQSMRLLPVRFIQRFQSFIQNRIIRQALDPTIQFQPPSLFRLPWLRSIPGRVIGFGLRRVHVRKF
jgi:2-polyprenyl-6-methoxyphenol hydroxylase-like FAD-dependent oxidoreductase